MGGSSASPIDRVPQQSHLIARPNRALRPPPPPSPPPIHLALVVVVGGPRANFLTILTPYTCGMNEKGRRGGRRPRIRPEYPNAAGVTPAAARPRRGSTPSANGPPVFVYSWSAFVVGTAAPAPANYSTLSTPYTCGKGGIVRPGGLRGRNGRGGGQRRQRGDDRLRLHRDAHDLADQPQDRALGSGVVRVVADAAAWVGVRAVLVDHPL
jgi:hypothetical protein